MSAGWVAGTVRARAMARRRLGPAGARALAAAPSLDDALATLAATSPYGHDVRTGTRPSPQAQRAVADTLLWDLRVLAGWLPRAGAERLRVLAGWFEIANVERAAARDRRPAGRRRRSGWAAWPRPGSRPQRQASPAELRRLLAASPWGDPGGETPRRDRRWRCGSAGPSGWLAAVPPARAVGGGRERRCWSPASCSSPTAACPGAAAAAARRLLGAAATGGGVASRSWRPRPRAARAALAGRRPGRALWRAEARWWARVDVDAAALLRRPRFALDPVVGAAAAAAVDAWRVRRGAGVCGPGRPGRWRCSMPWRERRAADPGSRRARRAARAEPVRMQRIAVVAPRDALRPALVRLADAGDRRAGRRPGDGRAGHGDAGRRLTRLHAAGRAAARPEPPDLAALEGRAAPTCWPARRSWRTAPRAARRPRRGGGAGRLDAGRRGAAAARPARRGRAAASCRCRDRPARSRRPCCRRTRRPAPVRAAGRDLRDRALRRRRPDRARRRSPTSSCSG